MNLPDYNLKNLPFMRPVDPDRMPRTEPYVVSPPALQIRASNGDSFTLGFTPGDWATGEFEYDVVYNGRKTGEFACRIECRGGKIRIFGRAGWRTWNGKTFI
jgi:hypothetical protein